MSILDYVKGILGIQTPAPVTDGVNSRIFIYEFPADWDVKLAGCVYSVKNGAILEHPVATIWLVTDAYNCSSLFMKTVPVCTMIMRIGDERRLVNNPHQIFGEDTITFYGDKRIQSKIEVFNNIAIARQAALAASAKQDQ